MTGSNPGRLELETTALFTVSPPLPTHLQFVESFKHKTQISIVDDHHFHENYLPTDAIYIQTEVLSNLGQKALVSCHNYCCCNFRLSKNKNLFNLFEIVEIIQKKLGLRRQQWHGSSGGSARSINLDLFEKLSVLIFPKLHLDKVSGKEFYCILCQTPSLQILCKDSFK